MSPIHAILTLVTLIAVPYLGYVLTGAWWGALVGFVLWLIAAGYFAQKKSST